MTIAVLNDIHGNRPALEVVLAEVDRAGCDRIVVGGDSALGPMPREVLELLMSRGERVKFVRGNCDRDMVTSPRYKIALGERVAARVRWAAEHITPAQRELLAALPLTFEADVEGLGRVLFCHGTPRSEDEIITSITPESRLQPIFAGVAPRIVVGGHTHIQYDREVFGKRLINAGSVGMPFEGRPGAYWALLGPDVRLMRTEYDYERAAREIIATGFPEAELFAHGDPTLPGSPAELNALFEGMADERAKHESVG
jgi:putative phosphoesterase